MHAARISTSIEADEIQHSTPIAAADDRNSPSLGSHPVSEERRFAPWRAGLPHRLAPRSSAARYGLAVIFAAAAYFAAILLEVGTGKFTVLSVLCGRRRRGMARRRPGPVVLRTVLGRGGGFLDAGAIQTSRSPRSICRPFAAFVVFALMTLAWSVQRRRAAAGARSDGPAAHRRAGARQRGAQGRNGRARGNRAGLARCRGGAGPHLAPGDDGRTRRHDRARDQPAAGRDHGEWQRLPALAAARSAAAR